MSNANNPQCPFIQHFAEDLKLARKPERTVQPYCRSLCQLSQDLDHDLRTGTKFISVSIGCSFPPGGRHIYAVERQPPE